MLTILKVPLNPGRLTNRDPYVMIYEIIPHVAWVVCEIPNIYPNKQPGALPFFHYSHCPNSPHPSRESGHQVKELTQEHEEPNRK